MSRDNLLDCQFLWQSISTVKAEFQVPASSVSPSFHDCRQLTGQEDAV